MAGDLSLPAWIESVTALAHTSLFNVKDLLASLKSTTNCTQSGS
jgi:hypothetical protein